MRTGLDKIASNLPVSPGTAVKTDPALQRTEMDRLKQACTDFESIFISMIMRQMMDSIPKSGQSDTGSSILSGIAEQAVGEHLAKSGGFGLADSLYRDLSKSLLR